MNDSSESFGSSKFKKLAGKPHVGISLYIIVFWFLRGKIFLWKLDRASGRWGSTLLWVFGKILEVYVKKLVRNVYLAKKDLLINYMIFFNDFLQYGGETLIIKLVFCFFYWFGISHVYNQFLWTNFKYFIEINFKIIKKTTNIIFGFQFRKIFSKIFRKCPYKIKIDVLKLFIKISIYFFFIFI